MTNMLIIIIGLFLYNDYYILFYTRFHSSPVEHENLRSKIVLMGNSTNFFMVRLLKSAKNKISNKCSIFQNHDLLVKRKINIK